MFVSANHPNLPGHAGRLDGASPAHAAEKHAGVRRPSATGAEPALQIPKMLSSIAAQPAPLDHSRIATVHAAIADGSYRLDSAATADAIMRHWFRQ